jgi:hypothetical protein
MRSVTISKGKKPLTFNEIEAVQFVAQFLEVSEYEVFQLAFNDWYGKRMNNMTMDYRFENYLDETNGPNQVPENMGVVYCRGRWPLCPFVQPSC